MRLGVAGRREGGSTDRQPLRNNVEHKHAEVDTPACGARLCAVALREPPFGKRDGSEDRQEYAEFDGRFHEASSA